MVGGPEFQLTSVAIEPALKTLRVVALEKVREGITKLEQVLVPTAMH